MENIEPRKGRLLLKMGPSGRPSMGIIYGLAFSGAGAIAFHATGYFLVAPSFIVAFFVLVFLYFYFRKPFIRIFENGIDLPVSIFEKSHKKMKQYMSYTDLALLYPLFRCERYAHNLSSIELETANGEKFKINTEHIMTWDGEDPGKKLLVTLKNAMGPLWKEKFQLIPPITSERLETIKKASRFDYINNFTNGFTFISGGFILIISMRLLPLALQIQGRTSLTATDMLYLLVGGIMIASISIGLVVYGFMILKRGFENWVEGANLYSQYNEYEEAKGFQVLPKLEPVKEDDWRMLSSSPPLDGEIEKIMKMVQGETLALVSMLAITFSLLPIFIVLMFLWNSSEALFILFIPFIIMPIVKERQIRALFAHVRLYKLLKGRSRDNTVMKLKALGKEGYILFMPRYWSIRSLLIDDEVDAKGQK